jgi:DNA-binding NtrC family response regulator
VSGRILVVEDDPAQRLSMGRYLTAHGFDLSEGATCQAAEVEFRARPPDVMLSDYQLPDGTGLELLAKVRQIDPMVPVVMLTGHGTIDLAVQAIKEGADQFLTKPVDLEALVVILQRLVEGRRAREAQVALQNRAARATPDPFLGSSSDVMRELRQDALRIVDADGGVLLLGETGTGKGVLAAWLHAHGPRARERFLDLNCAGLSRELLENELFGHERGAFTGAHAAKPGLLELADKGTLFLDEIGDVDIQVQPRLLKVLEEKRFRRLGDVKDRTVDVRLIAATHHDLQRAVRENKFRNDLFYRINVLPLRMPALRERREDIPALARSLLGPCVQLSPDAERALKSYSWPGNVRELRNVLERARVLSRSSMLEPADLRLGSEPTDPAEEEEPLSLEQMERRHIERVLRRANGQVARAAEVLGIARSSLYQKLQRYHLAPPKTGL